MARTAKLSAAGLVVLAVALLAWLVLVPEPAPINGVQVRPDDRRLEVSVGTCNQDPQVTAAETNDEVRLSSNEVLPRGASGDCLDNDSVYLDAPLGDRSVVDEATGDPVEVLTTE